MDASCVQAFVRSPARGYGRAGEIEPLVRVTAPRERRRSARRRQRTRMGARICALLVLALALAITLAIIRQLT
jgi:hypothetical protein